MARSRLAALAFCALLTAALPAYADGSASGLGSLQGIGSTQDLNRPVGNPPTGRVTGVAVDPSDSSSPRQFNGVVNRVSQGDTAAAGDPSGNTVYVGSANGGVWKTTNGGQTTNNAGVGFLRSMDGGKTWATAPSGGSGAGGHNTGALRNISNSNTGSTPPTGPAALRAKTK